MRCLTTLTLCLFTFGLTACDEEGVADPADDTLGDDDDTLGDDDDDTLGDDDDVTAGDDDDDAGHAAACAGLQVGSYQVDGYPVSGDVTGDLLADGTLYVTFVTTAGDTDAVGEISPSGVMSGTHQGVTIDGTYSLTGCQGTGRWVDVNTGTQGNYNIGQL